MAALWMIFYFLFLHNFLSFPKVLPWALIILTSQKNKSGPVITGHTAEVKLYNLYSTILHQLESIPLS